MRLSHAPNIVNSFKKWSGTHPGVRNDGNRLGPARPIVLIDPLAYGPNEPPAIVSARETA